MNSWDASNALKRLREATHQELCVPHASGVTPTPAEQVLWPVARELLQRLHGALESPVFDAQAQGRNFSVAMTDATAALLVAVPLQTLQRQRSRLDLGFVPLTTLDPRPLPEQGQADAAVGFTPDVSAALAAEGDDSPARRWLREALVQAAALVAETTGSLDVPSRQSNQSTGRSAPPLITS